MSLYIVAVAASVAVGRYHTHQLTSVAEFFSKHVRVDEMSPH